MGVSFKDITLVNEIPYDAIHWRNSNVIWKWCRQHTLIDQKSHDRWLEKISIDPTIKMFGIRLCTPEGTLTIGVCGFTSICLLNRRAEFSLYIAPDFQGEGYGKKALCALLGHGFNDWGFERIWGEVYEGNKSLELFLGIGMQEEGILRNSYFRNGKFINSHIVAMTREDYLSKRGEWDA